MSASSNALDLAISHEFRAAACRQEAAHHDAEAKSFRAIASAEVAAARAAELAEEGVRDVPVIGDDGKIRGHVQVICGPWALMGLGSRKRAVAVGHGGNLNALFEMQDTSRIRGAVKLTHMAGAQCPTLVHRAVERFFGAR